MKDNNNTSYLMEEDITLRPRHLNDFIGQKDLKEMLYIYIKASIKRRESLDHILLYGPPGLGKTTLAEIIANELNRNFKTVNGPSIEKTGDLVSMLTSLEAGDVLFIDEIHRIPKFIEEVLYSAMEDYFIDIIITSNDESKTIRIDLPPFTLIAATTRLGDLTMPLRDRFGVLFRLDYYKDDEIEEIIKRTSIVYETIIDDQSVKEIAKRSRATPRIANRLFRRIRDFADIMEDGNINLEVTKYALEKLKIDSYGLNHRDHKYIEVLVENFNGGPVGLENISSFLVENKTTIEEVFEPYLIRKGFIKRTVTGRVITDKGYELYKKIKEGIIE